MHGFTVEAVGPQQGRRGFDAYLEAFETETEGRYRHPQYSTATAQQFSGTFHNARLDDIVMAEYRATSRIRTEELATLEEDQVRLYVVHRGRQLLNDPLGRGDVRLDPGNFFLGRLRHDHHFETSPSIAALNLFLPGHLLGDLLQDRPLMSTAVSAPLRILSAHVAMVQSSLPYLGRSGTESARAALLELLKGVASGLFDDQETAFVPVLAQSARNLADALLEDPHLSPELIAQRLNVSVRTLQRSFAVAPEPLSAYIRRRRLEEATRMLLNRPSANISEVAARWCFADNSHFVRAFRKQHGCTPSQYRGRHRFRPEGEVTG